MPVKRSLSLGQVFETGLAISLEYEENDRAHFVLSRVEETAGDRLWVTMPVRAAAFVPLALDMPVIAYVKHEDGVYLMHGRVTGRRFQPIPMLEITATSRIQRRPTREYVRLRIILVPTSLMLLSEDEPPARLAATIVNLSAGGLMLRTRQRLEVEQRLHLVVELPDQGDVVDTTISVLRVEPRRAERGCYYEAGCCFIDLSDHQRDLITAFIFRSQARPVRAESPDPA